MNTSVVKALIALLCWFVCAPGPALAQSFGVGLSVTGIGDFGTGIFSTGIPGAIGAELRVERLDLIARGVSLRADIGTAGADALIFWRADLSEVVNLTLGAGVALIDYSAPGLVARVGLEYRFGALAACLEYGWRSSFATAAPATRSQWALGVNWFF